MKVRALRGVCYGIGLHLHPDGADGAPKEVAAADLGPALVDYLVNIGAVERVLDEPAVLLVADEPHEEMQPRKRRAKADAEEPTP